MSIQEFENQQISLLYTDSNRLSGLLKSLILNTNAIAQLSFGLQILPLTHQIATISGLPWNRCLRSNRSERVEYYLLHGFTQLGFIVPDKNVKQKLGKRKAKYTGGLVLEPKTGLYDDYVIVLDFNSLYPSIIQEFNLCYTTVTRAKHSDEAENTEEVTPTGQDDDGDVIVTEDAEFTSRYSLI